MKTEHRQHYVRWLAGCVLLWAAGCAGGNAPVLVIENEFDSENALSLEISEVLTRPCLERTLNIDALSPLPTDLPAEGPVTIPFGGSHSFELEPGCHDFWVSRDGEIARARVVVDVGDRVVWIPFQINANESWWDEDD